MTTETFSETVSKKRGRPRLWIEEHEQFLRTLYPEFSHRNRQNHYYASFATEALLDDNQQPIAKWVWLFVDPDTHRFRATVLTELGRLKEPELIVEAARDAAYMVEKHGFRIKAAALLVRGIRMELRESGS